MKKSAITILLTAVLTAVLIFAFFFFFMPTLGPSLMHGRMASSLPADMPAHMMNDTAPTGLDTATERLTEGELFRVSFSSDLDPVAINQMHSWTLTVATADGQPVENATITVDGGMPQHGHGLPTNPQVTEYLGDGRYRVEGLRFQMGGWWEVKFDITAAGQTDAVTFNLVLEG
jgi:hypothetical protein